MHVIFEDMILHENILSFEKMEMINKISKNIPDAYFGGSLLLNALGLLNRPVKDLDVVIVKRDYDDYGLMHSVESRLKRLNEPYKMVSASDEGNCVGCDIRGIKVDFWMYKESQVRGGLFGMELNGTRVKFIPVNYVINAKMEMIGKSGDLKKVRKHIEDVQAVNKVLVGMFG